MSIPIPILTLLLVIVASGLGSLAWWIAQRLGAAEWLARWIGLLAFGALLVFGHIV